MPVIESKDSTRHGRQVMLSTKLDATVGDASTRAIDNRERFSESNKRPGLGTEQPLEPGKNTTYIVVLPN